MTGNRVLLRGRILGPATSNPAVFCLTAELLKQNMPGINHVLENDTSTDLKIQHKDLKHELLLQLRGIARGDLSSFVDSRGLVLATRVSELVQAS